MSGSHRLRLFRALAAYGGVVVFSLLFAYQVLDLENADIHVPFYYTLDALLTSLPIKGIIDHGWYLENPSLGAPWGHKLYDYPFGEIFYFAIFKVMARFTRSFGVILNGFYILTFPLTSVTCLFAFRRLGISYGPAIVGSLLFAFQPYHLLRHELHLFLSSYFLVPLAGLVILRVGAEQGPFLDGGADGQAGRWRPTRAFYKAALVCLLVSVSGFYYAFFTGLLLLVAGGYASVRRRNRLPLLTGALLTGLIVGGMALTTLPSQVYWRQEGKNPVVARRDPSEIENNGLKIMQLLLPTDGHRLSLWEQAKQRYNTGTPLVAENRSSALGIVGAAGFLLLIGYLFVPEPLTAGLTPVVRLAAHLNLFCVLLAMVGAFGMVFALVVTPQIRAYNRISIFIAFWALCAVCFCLDAVYQRLRRGVRPVWLRAGWAAALCALVFGGLLDQTGSAGRPEHDKVRQAYSSDDRFVQKIEGALPIGAIVFQLPYAGFPEILAPAKMQEYQHLRGYLHSKRLRWSFGTMRGRPEDDAHKAIAGLPTPELVTKLRALGFAGIWLDRAGYADNGKAMEASLARTLQVSGPQFVSDDDQLSFFRLAAR